MKAIQIVASKSRRKSLEDKPMTTGELDKEIYGRIIEDYFRAFGTGDFSKVKFSSDIQFLSPISGITMNGRRDVVNFVSGVCTRVMKS